MEQLANIKRTFVWLRMCAVTDDSMANWERNAHVAVFLLVIFVIVSGAYANFVFFVDFLSADMDGSIFALLCSLALIEVFNDMIVAYLLQFRIHCVFENLSAIHKASKLCE